MIIQSSFLFTFVVHTRSDDADRKNSLQSNPSGLIRYVYIMLRGIVYAVELLGKQYRHLYKPSVFVLFFCSFFSVLFRSISEPSSFPIAAILVRKHAGM